MNESELRKLGISRAQVEQLVFEASIPEQVYGKHMADMKRRNGEITVLGLLKMERKRRAKQQANSRAKTGSFSR